jgi:hypothetical protein
MCFVARRDAAAWLPGIAGLQVIFARLPSPPERALDGRRPDESRAIAAES